MRRPGSPGPSMRPGGTRGRLSRLATAPCRVSASADKMLDGVTCLRLDASEVACHSDKPRRAEFQGVRPVD